VSDVSDAEIVESEQFVTPLIEPAAVSSAIKDNLVILLDILVTPTHSGITGWSVGSAKRPSDISRPCVSDVSDTANVKSEQFVKPLTELAEDHR